MGARRGPGRPRMFRRRRKNKALWLTCDFWVSEPVAGLVKRGEPVLKVPEGRWPILLIQIEQQFRTPGRAMVRPAADEAGHYHAVEKHVKAARRKPAKFIGHRRPALHRREPYLCA